MKSACNCLTVFTFLKRGKIPFFQFQIGIFFQFQIGNFSNRHGSSFNQNVLDPIIESYHDITCFLFVVFCFDLFWFRFISRCFLVSVVWIFLNKLAPFPIPDQNNLKLPKELRLLLQSIVVNSVQKTLSL